MATEENKVTIVGVNSANIIFNNDTDTERQYKVKANVNISNNNDVQSFDGGEVKSLESDNPLANFNFYAGGGININYNDHPDLQAQIAILSIINSFSANVIAYINTKGISTTLINIK